MTNRNQSPADPWEDSGEIEINRTKVLVKAARTGQGDDLVGQYLENAFDAGASTVLIKLWEIHPSAEERSAAKAKGEKLPQQFALQISDDGCGMNPYIAVPDREAVAEYIRMRSRNITVPPAQKDRIRRSLHSLQYIKRNVANSMKEGESDQLGEMALGLFSFIIGGETLTIATKPRRDIAIPLELLPSGTPRANYWEMILPTTTDLGEGITLCRKNQTPVNRPLLDAHERVLPHGTVITITGITAESKQRMLPGTIASMIKRRFSEYLATTKVEIIDRITTTAATAERGTRIITVQPDPPVKSWALRSSYTFNGFGAEIKIGYKDNPDQPPIQLIRRGVAVGPISDITEFHHGIWSDPRLTGGVEATEGLEWESTKRRPSGRLGAKWAQHVRDLFQEQLINAIDAKVQAVTRKRMSEAASAFNAESHTLVQVLNSMSEAFRLEGQSQAAIKKQTRQTASAASVMANDVHFIIKSKVGRGFEGVRIRVTGVNYSEEKATASGGEVNFGTLPNGNYEARILKPYPEELTRQNARFPVERITFPINDKHPYHHVVFLVIIPNEPPAIPRKGNGPEESTQNRRATILMEDMQSEKQWYVDVHLGTITINNGHSALKQLLERGDSTGYTAQLTTTLLLSFIEYFILSGNDPIQTIEYGGKIAVPVHNFAIDHTDKLMSGRTTRRK